MRLGAGVGDAFVHLHVASSFSLRYGASTPATLVARAKAWGQPALALTDRDGLYGAVRFAAACQEAGVLPILGVDLAVEPPDAPASRVGERAPAASARASPRTATPSRTPVRGGQVVDPRLPRVTVLARGGRLGLPAGLGWSRLCRLVTATHLRGERGTPVATGELLAAHARAEGGGPSPLVVLLGPGSDVGAAVARRRLDLAAAALARWRSVLPEDALALEVVCHGGPEGTPTSLGQAARMLGLARHTGVRVVLTGAVRHADPGDAAVVDVLDAARRLVPLHSRHVDRANQAGYLAPTPAMHATALDVVTAADPGISPGGAAAAEAARRLFAETMRLALECVQDPAGDLGIGSVHLPEPEVLGIGPAEDPQAVLAARCRGAVATRYPGRSDTELATVQTRLDEELAVIATLGYPTYFLTVAAVTDLIRDLGCRVAARGSGAGSLVNYLLGISGVDPIRYGLLMERFCSPLRAQLPDIDVDVESARRTEIYEQVLQRFGGERVTCVSMMDTYRVRHAIRDVGAALSLPPHEVDAMAKAFPHIAARNARAAIVDLPELRASGLGSARLDVFFELVERLDGLPRHVALHPCGVILSNSGLLDRTPVEASWLGFPMSQFDKDDVETLGLLKLDILGIRMQSAMAHAVAEVQRVDGSSVDLDDQAQVPLDDEATFRLIRTTHTLGCFQIESPGQRELVGKFGPRSFEDLVIDISLFRPGPVKSDMIVPFLSARNGWRRAHYIHPGLIPALQETEGVVVFHEQVLQIVAETTGVSLAYADEVRRALGSPDGQREIEAWWRPAARARGYVGAVAEQIWAVLKAFASFGFCKAHAAAFALPTYQSAWLKTHHPAAFLAGVLTHDPGMYPKRLILDDARSLGIAILGLDVNASTGQYRIERLAEADRVPHQGAHPDLPDASGYGIRLSLADVKGISGAEVAAIEAGAPYAGLADFVARAQVSVPVTERLILAGGFDSVYGIEPLPTAAGFAPRRPASAPASAPASRDVPTVRLGRRGQVTRRDLLVHLADLDRWSRSVRSPRGRSISGGIKAWGKATDGRGSPWSDPVPRTDVAVLASAQSQAARPVRPAALQPSQLLLDLGDTPTLTRGNGLPELTGPERVRAELDILGLDASAHVVDFYAPLLEALGTTRACDLLDTRTTRVVWVAGVKVATQTPPVRSGRRVVFLTVDDGTGPADATFFEDVQGPYAATIFHSWLLLVRGQVRRTGPRGVSILASGAWELGELWEAWRRGGLDAVQEALERADAMAQERAEAVGRSSRDGVGGPNGRPVLVHASGFRQSPYADVRPAGEGVKAPRKLWHASPGSAGH